MKYTAGLRILFSRHILVLLTGVVLGVGGCGGSGSTQDDPANPPLGKETNTAEAPTPPGGMELPSDLNINDLNNDGAPAATPEAGTSFELPK